MSLYQKIAPTLEPVTLQEAKDHLRVTTTDDDTVITNCIRSARWNIERVYRRACLTQSLVLGLDYFAQGDSAWMAGASTTGWSYSLLGSYPMGWAMGTLGFGYATNPVIELIPPVQSVTSITYLDTTGATQTLAGANYVVDIRSEPGRVMPATGKVWPVTAQLPGAVTIEFIAGHVDQASVPDDIKEAVKLIVGVLYENREQALIGSRLVAIELPYGVDELMGTYRRILVR